MATSSEIPAIPSEKRNATSRVTTLCEWSRCSLATIRDCIRFVRSNIPDIEYEKTTAPETKTKYTLFVYPSGLQSSRNLKKFKSLPSHFPESLLYQTLALESPLRDEIEIKFTTNFYQSPTKSIPFLLTADGRPLVGTQLTNLLIHGSETKKDEEPDLDLQTQAFIHMAENALGDALLYFYFFDQEYFSTTTRPLLGADLPWPVLFLEGSNVRNEVQKILESRHSFLDPESISKAASDALKIFEMQLNHPEEVGEQDKPKENIFFNGNSYPAILDFTVFAYFYLISNAFGKEHSLTKLALGFPNLKTHSAAILERTYKK
ncbi:Metaxin-2 [Entomophthora muscae]|uniref:Metaxin-2 n=1 Tax=Entomophthora muscae TaxID=34485 RepID=A0ACC2RKJ2_9FUNG|nr:Metaxin-2 [Entomophthora muscae]